MSSTDTESKFYIININCKNSAATHAFIEQVFPNVKAQEEPGCYLDVESGIELAVYFNHVTVYLPKDDSWKLERGDDVERKEAVEGGEGAGSRANVEASKGREGPEVCLYCHSKLPPGEEFFCSEECAQLDAAYDPE